MKKVYTKPAIMFEDFTLSTNIAGSCEIKTNTPNAGKCAYEGDEEYPIFTDAVSACITKWQDTENNGFCYHVPIVTNNLFNS